MQEDLIDLDRRDRLTPVFDVTAMSQTVSTTQLSPTQQQGLSGFVNIRPGVAGNPMGINSPTNVVVNTLTKNMQETGAGMRQGGMMYQSPTETTVTAAAAAARFDNNPAMMTSTVQVATTTATATSSQLGSSESGTSEVETKAVHIRSVSPPMPQASARLPPQMPTHMPSHVQSQFVPDLQPQLRNHVSSQMPAHLQPQVPAHLGSDNFYLSVPTQNEAPVDLLPVSRESELKERVRHLERLLEEEGIRRLSVEERLKTAMVDMQSKELEVGRHTKCVPIVYLSQRSLPEV
mmetsp:Transcript_8105/g.24422  ORF Transcript_8105/g.24422 Transcript_8105/m.24422 type:complete len:291 (-) Transcript_8105:1169-2041(-)